MVASSTTAELDRLLSLARWMSPEELLSGGSTPRPAPLWRTLLTTDGSTTLFLQALRRAPITLQLIDQWTAPPPSPVTDWLKAIEVRLMDREGRVLQRSAWLTDGRNRLALGYALIAPERLNPALQERLAAGTLPIGLLADELGLPSLRDHLEVGRVADAALAKQFGSHPDTFWCRRYRLRIPDMMTAAIIEIFSPSLDAQPAP
jgi:chorismate-pyruvate lyase